MNKDAEMKRLGLIQDFLDTKIPTEEAVTLRKEFNLDFPAEFTWSALHKWRVLKLIEHDPLMLKILEAWEAYERATEEVL